jgi:hypothetical protein
MAQLVLSTVFRDDVWVLQERAVLCTVSRFPESVYGREWAAVLVRLANRGLTPIDADTSIAETEVRLVP